MKTFCRYGVPEYQTNVRPPLTCFRASQCAIPVFEGLLPEPHNEILMTLLFRLAEWHGLAKLRMHTESTLSRMESVTTLLGKELRRFLATTCAAFKTTELEKEAAARGRRQNRHQAKRTTEASDLTRPAMANPVEPEIPAPKVLTKERKPKLLNIFIYKVHALGDYARTIRQLGPTDSYSTQTVSCFDVSFILDLSDG
jgi:hypothetical protein